MSMASNQVQRDKPGSAPGAPKAEAPQFNDAQLGRSWFSSWLSRLHTARTARTARSKPDRLPTGVEVTWSSASNLSGQFTKASDALRGDSVTIVVPSIAFYKRWFLLLPTVVVACCLGFVVRFLGGLNSNRGIPEGVLICLMVGSLLLFLLGGNIWAFIARTVIQVSPAEVAVWRVTPFGKRLQRFTAKQVKGVRWEAQRYQVHIQHTVMSGTHYRVWMNVDNSDMQVLKTEHVIIASVVTRAVRRCMKYLPLGTRGSPRKLRYGDSVVTVCSCTPDAIADELIEAGQSVSEAVSLGRLLATRIGWGGY